MGQPPNLYRVMAFDLHPKIKSFLDRLNQEGQIDLDADGFPYLLGLTREGPNFVIKIARNNQEQTVLLNTRKQADPVMNFANDGWARTGGKQIVMLPDEEQEGPKKERQKRSALESFNNLIDQILGK